MMVFEHLFIVVFFGFFIFSGFLVGSILAQFVDLDHIFNPASELGIKDRLINAVESLPLVTSDGYFAGSSKGLHRSILHSVALYYAFVFFASVMCGFVFGWGVHLYTDGIDIIPWRGF